MPPRYNPEFPFTAEFFAQYTVVRTIGQGAGGYVFEGRHNALKRPVAIKVLRQQAFQGEDARRRFLDEAKITSRLSHPNIVEVYDFGLVESVPYAVYEFVAGETLRDKLTRELKFPLEVCLRLMREILAGVGHAHRMGVMHRDLKPENILLDAEGRAKVADFGLAKGLVEREYQTEAGMLMGTLAYISPEQTYGDPATRASDVYALGVLLYEMVAGQRPFQNSNPMILLLEHQKSPAPKLTEAAHGCTQRVCDVVSRAMEKDPAQRYADAGEFLAALDGKKPGPVQGKRKRAGTEPAAHAATPAAAEAPHRSPAPRRVLTAAILLVPIALLAAALRGPPRPPAETSSVPPLRAADPVKMPAASTPSGLAAAGWACLARSLAEGEEARTFYQALSISEARSAVARFFRLWDSVAGCTLPALSSPQGNRFENGRLAASLFRARTELRGQLLFVLKQGREHRRVLDGVFREDVVIERGLADFDDAVARKALSVWATCSKRFDGSNDPYASSGAACILALARPAKRGKELEALQAKVLGFTREALPGLTSPGLVRAETVEQVRQLVEALRLAGAVQERRKLLEAAIARLEGPGPSRRLTPLQEQVRTGMAIDLIFMKAADADPTSVGAAGRAAFPDWVALRDRLLVNWPYNPRHAPPAGSVGQASEAAELHRRIVGDLAIVEGQISFLAQRLGRAVPAPPR